MKKILIALALLIAVFGLVSCEESNQEIDDFVYYALLERYQAILTEFQKFNNDEEPDGITFELIEDDEEAVYSSNGESAVVLLRVYDSETKQYTYYLGDEEKTYDDIGSAITDEHSLEKFEWFLTLEFESVEAEGPELSLDFSGTVKQSVYEDYDSGVITDSLSFSYTSSSYSFEVELVATGDTETETFTLTECLITYDGVTYDASAICDFRDWLYWPVGTRYYSRFF